MSAIVAGTCKKCQEKYYWSFGHPEWFDDVTKRGRPENTEYRAFMVWKKNWPLSKVLSGGD